MQTHSSARQSNEPLGRLESEFLPVLAGRRLLRDVCHAIPDAVPLCHGLKPLGRV